MTMHARVSLYNDHLHPLSQAAGNANAKCAEVKLFYMHIPGI